MNYTNEELIKRINIAQENNAKLTHITDKAALSTEDKIKLSLCKHFVQYANEKRLKAIDLHKLTNIPTTRISEISNYKIKKYSVDQLIKYLNILAKHAPRIREYLLFIEQAVEVPTLRVTETRKLTKGLKEVSELGSRSSFLHV